MPIHCDCSVDDYDPPRCYLETVRTARKDHSCCECGKQIKTGEKYEEVTGIWDGHPDRHRTCIICVRIRSHYCPNGFLFGELRETLFECLGFNYTEVPEEDE